MKVTPLMIEKCRQIENTDLRLISPKWAYGIYDCHIRDSALKAENNEYEFFFVKVSDLIKKADFGEMCLTPLFDGSFLNDQRISRLLFRWQSGFFVDPPTITINLLDKTQLSFFDGRHRSKLALHIGIDVIPIAIHFSDVEDIGKIIELANPDQ
ncbi:MAG TPA: hypothetical protein PKE30_00240 [Niabella sp.]|nr:hypothetical protein [Niabella sp.]